MADTANRPDLDFESDMEDIAETDPLAQLAFLMGDAPAASLARKQGALASEDAPDHDDQEYDGGVGSAPDNEAQSVAEPVQTEAPAGVTDSSLDDALMAELGADMPVADAGDHHPIEEVAEPEIEAELSAAHVEAVEPDYPAPIENVTTYPELEAERTPVDAPAMSLEDELQALLGGAATVAVADAVEAPVETSVAMPEPTAASEPVAPVVEDTEIPEADFASTSETGEYETLELDEQLNPEPEPDASLTSVDEEPVLQLSDPATSDEDVSDPVEELAIPKPFFSPAEDVASESVQESGFEEQSFDDEIEFREIEASVAALDDDIGDDLADVHAGDDHEASGREELDIDDGRESHLAGAAAGLAAGGIALAMNAEATDDAADMDAASFADEVASGEIVADSSAAATSNVASDADAFSDFDAALEDDFSQLFDEEIASETAPYSDHVESAAATGSVEHFDAPAADERSPLDELEALMADDGPLLRGQGASADAPPSLDTVDMTAFEKPNAASYDLPEAERSQPEAGGRADEADDLDLDFDFNDLGTAVAASAGTASAFRGAEVKRGGQSQPIDFDEAFSESAFEAELARDIEFVGHDRNAPRDQEISPFENATPAAASDRRGNRGLLIGGAVGALALLGAIGVYTLGGTESVTDEAPIVVAADPDPVKVAPEDPGGQTVPNQDRAVFGAEDGSATGAEQETLVTTSEEPVDIATAPGLSETSPDGEKVAERLAETSDPATPTEVANRSEGLTTPRRVRTLVVKPDGSLVEKPADPKPDTQIAAAEPVADVTATTPATDAQATAEANPEPAVPANSDPQESVAAAAEEVVPERVVEQPESAVAAQPAIPVRTVTTSKITPPIIRERPADQPVNIVNAQPQRPAQATQVAAAAPAPAAPVASSSSSPYAVQISSQTSRDAAQQSAANLVSRYRNLLGGRDISIQEAKIEGKGTYYRVRVGASSSAEATQLCENYKRAGGSCFVAR